MARLIDLGKESNPRGFYKFMAKANTSMRKIMNSNQGFEAMMKIAACMQQSSGRVGKIIRVQSKSQSRRREGLTRGNKRVPAGRPPKKLQSARAAAPKRVRSLAASIQSGKRHVKKH